MITHWTFDLFEGVKNQMNFEGHDGRVSSQSVISQLSTFQPTVHLQFSCMLSESKKWDEQKSTFLSSMSFDGRMLFVENEAKVNSMTFLCQSCLI